jgi:hypothetical protein
VQIVNARAWYAASIDDFRVSTTEAILGTLAKNGSFAMLEAQRDAWVAEIEFLRERLRGLRGAVFFEFSIPRMGRRIDVVLLISGVVFVSSSRLARAHSTLRRLIRVGTTRSI